MSAAAAGRARARPGAGFFRAGLRALLLPARAACLALLLAACAGTSPIDETRPPRLQGHEPPLIPDVDLLAVSPEMRAFTERFAGRNGSGEAGKSWMLAYAALDPYILDFDYDPMVTLPANEAFRARRGNCLTFSSLFVAMARSAGLRAWYQEVQVPPKWSSINETLLVSKHVNAVVSEEGRRFQVDVSRRDSVGGERTRRLSDTEAKAQYFNNLGVDALIEGDLALAYAYFDRALLTQPDLAYVWSNLGVVFRRNGQVEDAILAYRTALLADPDQSVALNNLHDLYLEIGDERQAAELERRVERNRRNNPYYLHHLAELANEERRWVDAVELLNQAIRIDGSEYRFHYSLAHAQYRLGRVDTARDSLARARELAASQPLDEPLALPTDP